MTDTPADEPDIQTDFDVVIIGAGPGGYSAALRAAQLGKSVALVEEDAHAGGVCLNEGCVPSKALLQTAQLLRDARHANQMGIDMHVQAMDLSRILGFKNRVVATEVSNLESLLRARKVTLFQATAQAHADLSVALSPSREARKGLQGTAVASEGEQAEGYSQQISTVIDKPTVIHGKDIVLATGSRPRPLPGADFSDHAVLDSHAALSLRQIPQSAIIIGSGAIGVEFATMWSSYGTHVTLLEAAPRILPGAPRRISAFEARELRRAGITLQTGVRILHVTEGANQVATVRYEDSTPTGPSLRPSGAITPTDPGNPNAKGTSSTGSGQAASPAARPSASAAASSSDPAGDAHKDTHELSAQFVLISIGRVPNTDSQWMKDLGLKMDDRGHIVTDAYGRTSIAHIWALGDITPGKQLAHRAYAQGLTVAESIAGLPAQPVDDHDVPVVSFALSQIALVGWDREEAQASTSPRFADVQEKTFPTGGNARVVMAGQQGSITVVSGYETDEKGDRTGERIVLGVQMIGPMVSELASEAEELVGNKVPLHEAARLVHPHPTFSETLGEALLAADGRPLHSR